MIALGTRRAGPVAVAVVAFGLLASEADAAPWIASGAVVRGDFDADGNTETVVSSPEADSNKGAVFVVDGAAGTATRWTRSTSGLAGAGAAAGDYFGAALAVGDLDGDTMTISSWQRRVPTTLGRATAA